MNEMVEAATQDDKKSGIFGILFSKMLGKAVLKELVKKDIIWAAGAGAFLLLFLWFHLSSLLIACVAITQIVFSFGVTQVLYAWVLGIRYFQVLHCMTVFLVLGIAADDIFVFYDTWILCRQKHAKKDDSEEEREL